MSVEIKNVALALGSNIGDRKAALKAALVGLAAFFEIEKQSPVYETAAAYVTDQPSFLNMAVTGRTKLPPLELLHALKKLESDVGREPGLRYGPRLLDIDIIFYSDQVLKTPELEIPHPKMHERGFVLRPLLDIAPDWKHPERRTTIAEMLAWLGNISAVNVGKL